MAATATPTVTQNDVTRAQLAYNAGFRGAALVDAIAISLAENNSPTPELNNTPATGDYSVGYWQINYYANLLGPRTARYGPPSKLLTDQQANANAAFDLSGGGKNFGPWSTFKSGAYAKYLPQASMAASIMDPTAAVAAGSIPMPTQNAQLVGFNPLNPNDYLKLPGTVANALVPGLSLAEKVANLLTPENLKFSFEIVSGVGLVLVGIFVIVSEKSVPYLISAGQGAASGVTGGPAGAAAGAFTFASGTRQQRKTQARSGGEAAADKVRLARQRRQEARIPPKTPEPFPDPSDADVEAARQRRSARSKPAVRKVGGKRIVGREVAA